LCELAEKLGADWDDISNSLRLDRRIGMNAYVTPGLGLSGGNIERDLRTTTKLANGLGTKNSFIQSIEQNSRHRKLWPFRIIQDQFDLEQKMLKIAIWGLAYKKNTNSIKNSPAINNMKMLASSCIFNVFDPIADLPESVELPAFVFSKILDSLNDVDALIIFNDSNIFSDVPISEISKRMKGNLIIDPFGMLTMNSENRFNYFKLGKIERKFT
jgi:UDPglucose 6-dehydrogenase